MAKKKSRAKSRTRMPKSVIWLVLTVISGGGVGGYYNPEWPLIGPLIQQLQVWRDFSDQLGGEVAAGLSRPPRPVSAQRPRDKLRIATFNIQVFGQSKMSKPDVVDVLVQIVRQFDIVAIQEVRAKEDDILPRFVQAINADGSQYHFLISERLGRTVSKEQYAFVYDTTRVEFDPSIYGTMPDPADMLHREPFVARFRPRTASPQHAFTFWLVNIHTDPDEVPEEISALADVFQAMRSARADEDDVILLGDLNASSSELGRLGQIPGMYWVVNGVPTNTRKTKTYDNVLFLSQTTSEYTGAWGVMDIEGAFGLSQEDALKVSDHLPVWAEFEIWESPNRANFADRVPNYRR